MTQHLMIDLETGGNSPGCAIFSIGACTFDPYTWNSPTQTFYQEISHSSCLALELDFDSSTMDWWKQQPVPIPHGTTPIQTAVKELLLWISNIPSLTGEKILCYWANSPSFDITILKYVINRSNRQWPLPYYGERCVRTLKAIAFPNGDYTLNNDHNALKDAINQAVLVQTAYHTLGLAHDTPTNQEHHRNPWPQQQPSLPR